jgi:hypothetical protein
MRPAARCLALLPLLLLVLARPAHADPMDDFSITTTGLAIDFSLPVSITQVCMSCLGAPNDQFNVGSVTGTVNGVSQSIHLNFVVGGICGECETILLSYDSTSWTIDLPALYQITSSGMYPNQDVTFTFVPGDYITQGHSQPSDYVPFAITVTPQTAATPEPSALSLSALAAASLCGLLLMKRRVLG